jgi:glutamate-5-semialdehyde dehydrogenase
MKLNGSAAGPAFDAGETWTPSAGPLARTPNRQAAAHDDVHRTIARTRAAAIAMRATDSDLKDRALVAVADALLDRRREILEANSQDVAAASSQQVADRLTLTADHLGELAEDLRKWVKLPDPVGVVLRRTLRRDGVELRQLRVPIGVVAVLYEEQASAAVRALGPLLKAGNAVLVRGARSATRTSAALVQVAQDAMRHAGLSGDAIQLVSSAHRVTLMDVITAHGQIDLLIPILGPGMRAAVIPEATVPIVDLGSGNCHIYIDATADLRLAEEVVLASKIGHSELSVAVETILVHAGIAEDFLPRLCGRLFQAGVSVHGDPRCLALTSGCLEATEDDWHADYRSLDLAVAVVDTAHEAIEHISRYGTGHTEAVITADGTVAQTFTSSIDSATVVVNAPTTCATSDQPADACFGYSTQRLPPRGPLGLTEFTTTRWIIWGPNPSDNAQQARYEAGPR